MRIPTVDYFLCCLSLETGALILGWIGAVGAIIALLITTVIFGGTLFDYPLVLNNTAFTQSEQEVLMDLKFFVTLFLFVLVLYCAFSLYASIQLIRSLKTRSSRLAKPYVVLIGVETIMAFLTILNFTWRAVIEAIVGTIFNGYLFICVHSLWEVFREEALRGFNRQYQPAGFV